MTTYTLFSQGTTGSSLVNDSNGYSMGVQFSVSQAATATAVWFYSAPGAVNLPGYIALFAVTGQTLVANVTSPTWSGAVGSGWVRAAFTSPPALTPGASYKAVVTQTAGVNWYSATSHYWDSGAGASGVTNGPLSAPNNAGGDGGQDTFFSAPGSSAYPASSFGAANYWVDPEVTTATPPAPPKTAATVLVHGRRRTPGLWRGMLTRNTGVPQFSIGLLTAFSAPGALVLGLIDETGNPVQDEAGGFILSEDGS